MKKTGFDLSASALQLAAMGFMLLDHLWATVVPGNGWMTCLGRLAFPIFAFFIAEGYGRTGNLKKYALRLGLFAVISEIPFNLMYAGRVFYPFHQNVLWTFLLALGLMRWNDRAEGTPRWRRLLRGAVSILLGFLLGTLTMVDYYGFGVVTVLLFRFFRGRTWWCRLGQLLGMYWIHAQLMGGLVYEFSALGRSWAVPQQAIALLALPLLWLYRGRRGPGGRSLRVFRYWFYPGHMLLLAALGYLLG